MKYYWRASVLWLFCSLCSAQTSSQAPVYTNKAEYDAAWKQWNSCVWKSPGVGKECGPGPKYQPLKPRAGFSKPSITGIRLDKASIDLLKAESEKLRLAGATKNILAWSPLIELVGENNAVHAAFSISQTNWEELAKSFSAVDKTVFYSLATDARTFANSDATWGNPQAKQFWNAMADFYAAQAPER
jgi:hypothetical protein